MSLLWERRSEGTGLLLPAACCILLTAHGSVTGGTREIARGQENHVFQLGCLEKKKATLERDRL